MSSNLAGNRIYIIGDSLSLPGNTPGRYLATELRTAGAVVKVGAIGGFAISYFRPGVALTKYGLQAALMIESIKHFHPNTVLMFLGTNDYAQGGKNVLAGLARYRAEIKVHTVGLGPPSFAPDLRDGAPNKGSESTVRAMKALLPQFIDTRPLSTDLVRAPDRSKDGIHFTKKGAEIYGRRMYYAVIGKQFKSAPSDNVNKFIAVTIATYFVGKALEKLFK